MLKIKRMSIISIMLVLGLLLTGLSVQAQEITI